jgi:DNA-binding PadR family transcriptional regulator
MPEDPTDLSGPALSGQASDDMLGMPTTAYLVLGILSVFDEQLTAGEIKNRAEHTIGRFYWSPAVSHIRRELTRMLGFGLVSTERIEVGARSMTVYEITREGETILRKWAGAIPEEDLVVKHPLMLKIWLASDPDPSTLLLAIDQYIDRLEFSIEKAHWARRRGREVGRSGEGEDAFRYPRLVMSYNLRSLYSELANVRQLRDEIAWTHSEEPPRVMNLPTTQVRRRRPAGGDSESTPR